MKALFIVTSFFFVIPIAFSKKNCRLVEGAEQDRFKIVLDQQSPFKKSEVIENFDLFGAFNKLKALENNGDCEVAQEECSFSLDKHAKLYYGKTKIKEFDIVPVSGSKKRPAYVNNFLENAEIFSKYGFCKNWESKNISRECEIRQMLNSEGKIIDQAIFIGDLALQHPDTYISSGSFADSNFNAAVETAIQMKLCPDSIPTNIYDHVYPSETAKFIRPAMTTDGEDSLSINDSDKDKDVSESKQSDKDQKSSFTHQN